MPGRWNENLILIILPETKVDQTKEIIKKLSSVFNNYQELFDDQTIEIKSSICSEEIFAEDTEAGYLKIVEL